MNTTRQQQPIPRRASATNTASHQLPIHGTEDQEYEGFDNMCPTRLPTSTRKYNYKPTPEQVYTITQGGRQYVIHTSPPPSRQAPPQRQANTEELPIPKRPRVRLHPLVYIGISLFLMLIGWIGLTTLQNFIQTTQDDLHFGRPRTFQIDAVVGHNDSILKPSHFIAVNLNRHIQIIELPGGNPSKAHIYSGPSLVGDNENLVPVTLSFKDINHDGKPDMLVHILDQTFVMINDNSTFRPQKPGET